MSIAFDNAATVASGGTFTCTGANGLLFACITSTTDDISAVTFGGQAMSLVKKDGPITSDYYAFVYKLSGPATGSQTFTITGGTGMSSRLTSYTGCTGAIDSSSSVLDNAGHTSVSISTTVVASNCWLLVWVRNDESASINFSSGAAATARIGASNPRIFDSNATVATGLQTSSYNTSDAASAHWVGIILSFVPGTIPVAATGDGLLMASD